MNQGKPLISVIVPIYKVEPYLRQCLDSILAQTYKNIEVIMVDDGSPDNCGAICEEYAAKYKNFIAVHKENAGLGMARNTGMTLMKGEYVMFVDSDDFIDPDLIENLYDAIQKNGVDISKSCSRDIDDRGVITCNRRFQDEVFPDDDAAKVFLPRMLGSAPNKKDVLGSSAWGNLYKTSHIINHGINFPSERVLISEDLIFNIEYMQYAKGACTISKIGYNYRYNKDSLTKSYRADRFEACAYFHKYVLNWLKNLGYDMDTIYRLDKKFFINAAHCIHQERINKASIAITNIKIICNNNLLQSSISEYPVQNLTFSQRFFLFAVKHKLSYILYLCLIIGAI